MPSSRKTRNTDNAVISENTQHRQCRHLGKHTTPTMPSSRKTRNTDNAVISENSISCLSGISCSLAECFYYNLCQYHEIPDILFRSTQQNSGMTGVGVKIPDKHFVLSGMTGVGVKILDKHFVLSGMTGVGVKIPDKHFVLSGMTGVLVMRFPE